MPPSTDWAVPMCGPPRPWAAITTCMVGMDEMPTNQVNDVVYRERASTQGLDYGSVSFGDSLENNVAAPRELASLLAAIYRGQVVSAAASKAMIELLKTGRDTRMIRCYLQPDVVVAHKYGSSGIIKGDAGLVFLPDRPLGRGGLCASPQRRARRCRGPLPRSPVWPWRRWLPSA